MNRTSLDGQGTPEPSWLSYVPVLLGIGDHLLKSHWAWAQGKDSRVEGQCESELEEAVLSWAALKDLSLRTHQILASACLHCSR